MVSNGGVVVNCRETGVGCNTPIGTTKTLESNKIETLRLLLAMISSPIYSPAGTSPPSPFLTPSNRPTLATPLPIYRLPNLLSLQKSSPLPSLFPPQHSNEIQPRRLAPPLRTLPPLRPQKAPRHILPANPPRPPDPRPPPGKRDPHERAGTERVQVLCRQVASDG